VTLELKHKNYITLPIITFLLGLIGCISLLQFYEQSWQDEHIRNLNNIALTKSVYITRHLDKTISSAYILGSIIKQNHGEIHDFESYAHDIYDSIGNITNLQLAPNGIIEKIYPLLGHEKALGHDLINDDRRKKEALLAIESRQLTLAGPFQLVQGGTAIIGRYPVFLKTEKNADSFWGFASVLIYLDELLKTVGFDDIASTYNYQLSRIHPDNKKLEVFSGKNNLTNLISSSYEITVPNGKWFLSISKKGKAENPPLYFIALLTSFIAPLILALFLFFLLRQPKLLSDLVDEKTEQLEKLALYDSLTGLVNRYEFERRVLNLISNSKLENSEHALCYMDLDQFKVINDTCGHIAGDELLRQLCQLLKQTVRQSDVLARLGGDEFGLLMEHCSLKDAQRVAGSFWKIIQDYQFKWENRTFKVGVSIGLVVINKDVKDLTALLSMADTACYIAKDTGRNKIHVYQSDDTQTAQMKGEMQWVTRLHHALEHDLFCLYAHSIVSICNETDKYFELLIRMKDGNGKIIAPGVFLPSAERYNLMEKIDRWAITSAFDLLKSNPAFLNDIKHVSINLSGQSLANDKFLDFVITKLQENKVQTEKICFEITETAAIHNINTAIKFITTLKELGCSFALDDFGSGLSSFAYLKNLPVDYLKIDGMFVKDIIDDPIDYAMVKSINEVGQLMGMKTIAEFVENDEIKEKLKVVGVDYVQGYGISKPTDFYQLLHS